MSKEFKIMMALLILIMPLSAVFIINNNKNKPNVVGGILQEGVIPGYTEEQIKEILQRKADESTFSFEITLDQFLKMENQKVILELQIHHIINMLLKLK